MSAASVSKIKSFLEWNGKGEEEERERERERERMEGKNVGARNGLGTVAWCYETLFGEKLDFP